MAEQSQLDRLLNSLKEENGCASWNSWRIDCWMELTKRGRYLESLGLHGAKLAGTNLSDAKLDEVDLSWADLTAADLRFAKLLGANLSNAKLNKAQLYVTKLGGADLSKADLSEALLYGTELNDANLNEAKLNGANLTFAHLIGAKLNGADLTGANLDGADLSGARLVGANLGEARLSWANAGVADMHYIPKAANITRADLSKTNLKGANLAGANLRGALLIGADLDGANVGRAYFGETVFGNTNLSGVKGLDYVYHSGPSMLDLPTLERSKTLPEKFLRGCGLPDAVINYLPSLLGEAPQFYSCFISYSHIDEEFVERLYDDLQNNGVRCWFAPHDMRGGRKIIDQIDTAIGDHDKLLLVLSEASMRSSWVRTEIAEARAKEEKTGANVLFPVRLVEMDLIRQFKLFDADRGIDSARELREYHIPDFSKWEEIDAYGQALQQLLRDLRGSRLRGG